MASTCNCATFIKQGTSYLMPVRFIGLDLDDVSSIDFRIQQNSVVWEFSYPSNSASRRAESEDIVDVVWTEADTWKFHRNHEVLMDTKVHLADSWENPQTPIVSFQIGRTLFEESDAND